MGITKDKSREITGVTVFSRECDIRKEAGKDFIEGNIFYKSIKNSPATECAMWILNNERKVKNKIRYTFSSMGHADADVEECYDHMLYYFIEFSHNAFDENYFVHKEALEKLELAETMEDLNEIEEVINEAQNDSYKMEYYILNRVKNGALGYIRHLNRSREVLKFDDTDVYDKPKRNMNTITMDIATYLHEDDKKSIDSEPDIWVEYSELQDILDKDLHIYDEEFQNKGLRDFSTKKYVEALFLMGFEEGKDDELMAAHMGVTLSMFNNYRSGFKIIVKDEIHPEGEYCDLYASIAELVEGIKHKWKPILRD